MLTLSLWGFHYAFLEGFWWALSMPNKRRSSLISTKMWSGCIRLDWRRIWDSCNSVTPHWKCLNRWNRSWNPNRVATCVLMHTYARDRGIDSHDVNIVCPIKYVPTRENSNLSQTNDNKCLTQHIYCSQVNTTANSAIDYFWFTSKTFHNVKHWVFYSNISNQYPWQSSW